MTNSEESARTGFDQFELGQDVLEAVAKMGIEEPTPIQLSCIPGILAGDDVVGKAETGTGKTLGYSAPLVSRIDTQRVAVQALILAPTRELAQQVAGVLEELGAGRDLSVALLVGGEFAGDQILQLRGGCQVVVGTPGRVLDLLGDRYLSLVWCETVILDEADRMLDMGFIKDVTDILAATPKERQTLLFSATFPRAVEGLCKKYMRDPVICSTRSGLAAAQEIRQQYVETDARNKFKELRRVLEKYADGTVMVFCNTRRKVIDLDRMLWGHGYSAGSLHGDQQQEVRYKVLDSFRRGEIKVLVSTDVASRGLDIEDVSCVVNFDIPEDEELYVHRIGRTGRAQKAGTAIALVSRREQSSWQKIQRATRSEIERVGSRAVRGGGGGAAREVGRSRPARGSRRARSGKGAAPSGNNAGKERAGASRPSRRRRSRSKDSEEPPARTAGAGGTGSVADDAPRPRPRRDSSRRGSRSAEEPVSAKAAPEPDGSDRRGGGEAGDTFTTAAAATTGPRRPAPPSTKAKMSDVDDDFIRVDYFDIDRTVLKRSGENDTPPVSEDVEAGAADPGAAKKRRQRRSRRRRGGRGGSGSGGGGREVRREPQAENAKSGGDAAKSGGGKGKSRSSRRRRASSRRRAPEPKDEGKS